MTWPATGAAGFVNAYQYDQYGNETRVSQSGTDAAPKTVTFGYDLDNDLASVVRYASGQVSSGSLVVSSAYTYDLDGRITVLSNTGVSGNAIDNDSDSDGCATGRTMWVRRHLCEAL